MNKTICRLFLLMIITGLIFTACSKQSANQPSEQIQEVKQSGGLESEVKATQKDLVEVEQIVGMKKSGDGKVVNKKKGVSSILAKTDEQAGKAEVKNSILDTDADAASAKVSEKSVLVADSDGGVVSGGSSASSGSSSSGGDGAISSGSGSSGGSSNSGGGGAVSSGSSSSGGSSNSGGGGAVSNGSGSSDGSSNSGGGGAVSSGSSSASTNDTSSSAGGSGGANDSSASTGGSEPSGTASGTADAGSNASGGQAASEPVVTVSTVYKDGAYSASGSYQSPAGAESITVTVTIKNDVVESLNVSASSSNATSQAYQNLFVQGINGLVVGKNIDQISGFSQVNGSSLTPSGFNSAFALIKASAK